MQIFAPKKKPRVQPLSSKDIYVAELDCKDSIDRTEQYRAMIAQKHHPLDLQSEDEDDIMIRTRTETEKLKLLKLHNLGVPAHLQNQTKQQDRLIQEMNSLEVNFDPDTDLHLVVERIQKRIAFYTEKQTKTADALEKMYNHYHSITVQGRISVDKASSNSEILYQTIIEARKSYSNLRTILLDKSLKITNLQRRSKNIESVLQIIQIWKKTFVGKLSKFEDKQINQINIEEMFKTLDEVGSGFKKQGKDYKNYGCFIKMEQFLKKKRQSFVRSIQENYQMSIFNFNQKTYSKILSNYNKLLSIKQIKNKPSLSTLLDKHISYILQNITPSHKQFSQQYLNQLTNEKYLLFFDLFLKQIQKYCRNWHLATRWHIQFLNPTDVQEQNFIIQQGKEQLRFRKTIFQKVEERLSDIISKSFTFYKLTINQRMRLIITIHKIIKEVGLFSRETPKMIGEVVKKKSKQQRQIMQKSYKSWLKQTIVGQIRNSIFQQQHETRPYPSGIIGQFTQQQLKIIQQFQTNRLTLDFQSSSTDSINTLSSNQNGDVTALELKFPEFPNLPQYSSAILICKFTQQISKRIYFNPKIVFQMFTRLKQMFELEIISLYYSCCPQTIQKQLQETWAGFNSLKFSKYDDVQVNIQRLQYFQNCQQLQSQYFQLSLQVPNLLNKFPINQNAAIVPPSLQTKGVLLQSISVVLSWLKTHLTDIFSHNIQKQQKELIDQEFSLLGLLVKELVTLIYNYASEDTKARYQNLASSVKDLKWEIKKYNNDISELFKGYKNNYFGVLESQILPVRALKVSLELKKAIQTSLVNDFFKALTQAYSRVQKINSNGRQLMRLQALQLQGRIKQMGISTDDTYLKHLFKFIEMGVQGDPTKLQTAIKANLENYSFRIWKPLLVSSSAADEISWSDRRDILLRLAQHYLGLVSQKKPM